MFGYATTFNGDLSKWDVSKVIDMNNMFNSAVNFNGDLSKWDVSKVTAMEFMFAFASNFKGDLSKWDVSKVVDMNGMFAYDSCSVCDRVPHGLQGACQSSCNPLECANAVSKNQCTVLTQCAWCKSKDYL